MRKTTILIFALLTLTKLTFGQDPQKLSFPEGVFNCDTIEDRNENIGWSNVLNDFKTKSLYLNENKNFEIYRLIHWGSNLTILECTKQPSDFLLKYGSTDLTTIEKKKIYLKTLKLSDKTQQNRLIKFFEQVELKENRRKCVDENIFVIDDRDSWIFEIKNNDKYKFLKTKELDEDLKALVDFITNELEIKI